MMDFSNKLSSYCKKCNTKNQVVMYMIEASQNSQHKEQEQAEMNAYQRMKSEKHHERP